MYFSDVLHRHVCGLRPGAAGARHYRGVCVCLSALSSRLLKKD